MSARYVGLAESVAGQDEIEGIEQIEEEALEAERAIAAAGEEQAGEEVTDAAEVVAEATEALRASGDGAEVAASTDHEGTGRPSEGEDTARPSDGGAAMRSPDGTTVAAGAAAR